MCCRALQSQNLGVDNRQNLVQFILQHRGGHRLLTGQHLVGVSADGVDLAVVYDETVRMGSLPAWFVFVLNRECTMAIADS